MKRIVTVCVLVFFTVLNSVKVTAQATCTGVINSVTSEFCVASGSYTFANAVAIGENVQWLTSGDGVFNNPNSQNPTYTPGPADITNGFVFIYLDVYRDDPVNFCSVLPVATLHLGAMRTIATPATQTSCSGSAITNIVMSGGLSTTTYNWTRNNTTTITGTVANSGTGNVLGNLINTTTNPVNVQFTITPTVASCTGTPINAVVTVNPRVIATASVSTQTICSGSAITPIALSSSSNNTTYSWTRTNTSSVTGIASSGTDNITGTLTNTGSSAVTVTFTVTPTANGCTGTAITSSVTVNPASNVTTSTPALQSVCSGSAITNITSSGAGTGAIYNWTRNNTASVTGIANTGSGTISGSLTNTTTSPVYVTFTITPTTNSCSNRASVLVNPTPTASATPSAQTVCSGVAITPILLSSNTTNTTYSWTRNNTASVTGIASSGNGNITGALTNTTSSSVTVTFTITPSVNGCTGTPITATVAVTPGPNTATATPSTQTICSGANITSITTSGGGTGTTYNWYRNNLALATGMATSGSGTITGQLNNTISTALTVTFTITPTRNGCVGTPVTANVVVNAAANTASATPSSQTICSGTPISQVVLSGATSYNWTRSNTATVTGISASGTGNISGTLTNTTNSPVNVTFTITPTTSGCTGLLVSATVLVNPRPASVISGSQAVCTGGPSATISIAFTGAAPRSFTYTNGITPVTVNGNSANPYTFQVAAVPRTYTVTALSDANCIAQAADMTGSAVISQQTYTINASAGANGTISPSGATTVNCGSNQTYSITPNSGYIIQNVLVDGVSVGAQSSYTFSNVTATHTISVSFAINAITITATAGANGAISPSGAVAVSMGASQTFAITAASCYQVSNVLVDGISVGAVSTHTFNNVTAPHTISASFAIRSYAITATAGANGSITPSGTTNVNCGGSQSYTITPNSCYRVADVLVDGVSVGAVTSHTFNNVTVPHTISVSFALITNAITATAGANGSITPSGTTNVNCGGSQSYTITPNSCYRVANVIVDGVSVGAVTSHTFNNVTVPHSISVSFALITNTITATAGANGSITPSGTTNVNCGGSQSYTITPNSCYRVADVLVDGVSVGAVTSHTFNNVTVAHSISVSFALITNTITATAGANGSITPSGTTNVNCGSNQTYSITPNSGYIIQNVLVDGVSVGAQSSYTFSNVTATHTISVSFAINAITITATAGANGAISPTGAVAVSMGASQTFAITAASCYQVSNVLVDGVSVGAVSTHTFNNVTAPYTISASFAIRSYTITATAGANGSITPSGTTNVNCGGSQSYTITPNSCYRVADVLVDGVSVGAVTSHTFNNVTVAHTISASFALITNTITATAGANGSITPAGTTSLNCGSSQSYTITANPGYNIQDVLVDGISQGATSTITFNNVTANHTIHAVFSTGAFTITASAGANGTITPSGAVGVTTGSNQTFNIASNSCYQLADVVVDGISVGDVSSYTFFNVTAPHTISASFIQLNYTITATAGANGSITPAGTTNLNCGSSQSYTITANPGYNIQDVTVDGISQGPITSHTFANVSSNHTINVTFSTGAITITATAGTNGSITPSGAVGVTTGSSQTFGIAANSCYQIADVLVDGNSVGAVTSHTFNNVTVSHTISATFSQLNYGIIASAGENGSITPAGLSNVACGGSQTYTITPNSCYHIENVLVDGISVGAVSSYTFNNVTSARTISVTFAQSSYTITATAGANGSITPSGTTNLNCGSSQSYTITANPGYNIQDVTIDGVSQGPITSHTFTNVSSNHTINVAFSTGAITITATAGANGTITPSGAVGVTTGSSQTFNIAANSCYQIADVLVDGNSVGAVTSHTFDNVTVPHTISATFSQLNYTITATAGANGSITPAGTTNLNCGSSQSYTITANPGYNIQDVTVDGISQGPITSHTFANVSSNHTINVTFSTGAFTITATAGTNGSITPSGAVGVATGSSQTFNIAANSCYQIADVLVDGNSVGAVTSHTFDNVTVPHTISATFSQLNYSIIASAGENGSITPAGLSNVACGGSQVYAITPNTCYRVADVMVDGISQGPVTSYTFSNVTAHHNIIVTFEQSSYTITASTSNGGNITPAGVSDMNCGGSQYYSITPDPGFIIQNVLVDGVSVGVVSEYTFNNVIQNHTIQAVFGSINSFTISASADANGSISPAGQVNVSNGGNQTFTFTTNNCYQLADVQVDGVSQGIMNSYTFNNINASHSIHASFIQTSYSITATAGNNGSISPAGISNVNCSGSITYTFTPSSCYNIADVLIDGISAGPISSYTFNNVTSDHTVSVTFTEKTYIIAAEADANGTITPAGNTTVACGGSQTFSIEPKAGFSIADVLVDGVSVGALSSYTFNNVSAAHSISAVFNGITYVINASAGSNGSISPTGSVSVVAGGNQSFTITPSACYQVNDVLVDGISVGAVTTHTFNTVAASHTISAAFTQIVYTITASAGPNGSITPAGSTNVLCGTNQTYIIAANNGFTVQNVLVDGVPIGAVSSYTFNNVTASHTISATYTVSVSCTTPTITTTLTNVLCRNASTGAITLNTTGGTAPFTYSWTGPNGFASSTRDLTGLAAGTYALTLTASGGCTTTASATITQPATAITGSATAAAMACNGTSTTLTVTSSGGTGARMFSLNGGTFQTGTTFTVTAAGSPYTVTIRDANNCLFTTNVVVVAPAPTAVPPAATVITGPNYGLCGGGTFSYTVQPVPTATLYVWSGPAGTTIIAGQNTLTGTFSFPTTYTSNNGGVWVVARNACGSAPGLRYPVFSTLTYPATSMTGPSQVSPGQTGVQYSLPNAAGATYNWLVPAGSSIVSGQGTGTITVNFGTTAGNVSCDIVNACGTGPRINRAITFVTSRPMVPTQTTAAKVKTSVESIPVVSSLSVYPNPVQGVAIVAFNAAKSGSRFDMAVTNIVGKTMIVKSSVTIAGSNVLRFDLTSLPNGVYIIKLVTEEGIETIRMVKNK